MTILATSWLSDPAWCAMDPTARGFHAQLVLLAARSGGRLPDDEAVWRRWLGLPDAGGSAATDVSPAAMAAWIQGGGAPDRWAQLGGAAALMEHHWVTRWRPMVRAAWVDDGQGELTCPAAQTLAGATSSVSIPVELSAAPTTAQPVPRMTRRRATRARTTGPAITSMPLDRLLAPSGPVDWGQTWALPMDDRCLDVEQVQACWHVPETRAVRLNLWAVGLRMLSTGPGDESATRSFLASLIRLYGERRVAAAVGEMSGRSTPAADPRAFLRGLLRRDTEGSAAAQQARQVRSRLPL